MRRYLTHVLPGLMLVAACSTGKEPPAPTALIKIPGGTFTLGSSELKCGDATTPDIEHCDSGKQLDPLLWIDDLTWVPAATATVPAFEIEEHEVTNAQYAHCVELGDCTPPAFDEVGTIRYFGNPDYDASPVVWVTRKQAEAYCASLGLKLPSEAQWERAARLGAGNELRTYPWKGDAAPNCTRGSSLYLVSRGCSETPLPVGYSDADMTYHKVRNMASNVSEWVLDDWSRFAYCEGGKGYAEACQTKGDACADCVQDGDRCAKSCQPDRLVICGAGTYSVQGGNPTEGVVRGGSYLHSRCFHRLFVRRRESAARPEIGFRCVPEPGGPAPDGSLPPDAAAADAGLDAGFDAPASDAPADGAADTKSADAPPGSDTACASSYTLSGGPSVSTSLSVDDVLDQVLLNGKKIFGPSTTGGTIAPVSFSACVGDVLHLYTKDTQSCSGGYDDLFLHNNKTTVYKLVFPKNKSDGTDCSGGSGCGAAICLPCMVPTGCFATSGGWIPQHKDTSITIAF